MASSANARTHFVAELGTVVGRTDDQEVLLAKEALDQLTRRHVRQVAVCILKFFLPITYLKLLS
jgi:hypothetical protein